MKIRIMKPTGHNEIVEFPDREFLEMLRDHRNARRIRELSDGELAKEISENEKAIKREAHRE